MMCVSRNVIKVPRKMIEMETFRSTGREREERKEEREFVRECVSVCMCVRIF